ncbi:hypothetical protein EDD85DRAFT_547367 [Armillaria nabsnona]|nr:hypothetical protein EDD85DRAFT_547367 [Armillaria nabsnona]
MCASSIDTIPPNTMAITAPRLVSLEISTFSVTPSILGHLILPSLQSFSTSAGSQGVAALIERSKCPLQKLEIRATRSTLECQNLLTVMPTSETFTSAVYGNRGYGADDLGKLMSATSHLQHLKSVDLTYKAGRGEAYRNLCMSVLETGYPVLTVRIPAKTALPAKMFVSRSRTDSDSDSDSDE